MTADELLEIFRQEYIENGYMYSGCQNYNAFIYQNGQAVGRLWDFKEALDELLKRGVIRLRNCDAYAFELIPQERALLIREHGLAARWEREAPYFYPNEWKYGEVPCTLREAAKLEPQASLFA